MALEKIFNVEIDKNKKKINIIKEIAPYVKQAKDEGYSIKDIFSFLKEKKIIDDISYNYFRKNIYITDKDRREDKKIIAIVNFKGGVGKSTIANLLELPDKVIINLDPAQDAKKINTDETYNFYELKEEYGIDSIKEAVDGAFEAGKRNVILDTAGEIGDFLEVLPEVDYFIIPFTPADRSIETTIATIDTINSLLDDMVEERKDKWCIVLNRYLTDDDLKELDEVFNKAKEILGNRLKCKSALKTSQVISTIERKKKTIDELIKENPIAYGAFKKRVKEMNKDIKEFLGEQNG